MITLLEVLIYLIAGGVVLVAGLVLKHEMARFRGSECLWPDGEHEHVPPKAPGLVTQRRKAS